MRTIYSQAALVVAWLGVQDDYTAQWMTALDEISHADSIALLSLCDRVELRFWPVLPDYTISTKELFTRLVNRAQLSDSYKRSRKDLSDFLLDYALCLKRILKIGDGGRSSAMLLPYT
jgi:hypothetical protein